MHRVYPDYIGEKSKIGILHMAIQTKHLNVNFHVGDTVKVHYLIIEKDIVTGKTKKEKHEQQKERIQIFQGIVLAIRGSLEGKSFIVRHIGAGNIGVERIFPLNSPWIKKITIWKKGNVRRAKLYYLRHKTGKDVAALGVLVKEEAAPKKSKASEVSRVSKGEAEKEEKVEPKKVSEKKVEKAVPVDEKQPA